MPLFSTPWKVRIPASLPAQPAQVLVAGFDALDRLLGVIMFDDVVLDSRDIGLGENPLPVDDPAADFGEIHAVAEILRAAGCDLGQLLDVLYVHERESAGIFLEVLHGI